MKTNYALMAASLLAANIVWLPARADNFYTPNPPAETLGEIKDAPGNGLTNPAGNTVYTTHEPDHPLGATPPPATAGSKVVFNGTGRNYIKAGNPDDAAVAPVDTGNNHSTGSAAVVRSGVGVETKETGVDSGMR